MIACISPVGSHYEESLNTLKYANRAKNIKTTNYRRNVFNNEEETEAQVYLVSYRLARWSPETRK